MNLFKCMWIHVPIENFKKSNVIDVNTEIQTCLKTVNLIQTIKCSY